MRILLLLISLVLGAILAALMRELKAVKENIAISEERIKGFKQQYTTQKEEVKKLKSQVVELQNLLETRQQEEDSQKEEAKRLKSQVIDLQNLLETRQQEENYGKEVFILERKDFLNQIDSLKSELQELKAQQHPTQKHIDTGEKAMTKQSDRSNSLPLIGSQEQDLFSIADTREKADKLQEVLLPKLESILNAAQTSIREIYGKDALPSSLFRVAKSPAHRKTAKKTEDFQAASIGLCFKPVKTWFFQLQILCEPDNIHVQLFGLRGKEANPLVKVLKSYKSQIVDLCDLGGFYIHSEAFEPSFLSQTENQIFDPNLFIDNLQLIEEREWKATVIHSAKVDLPLVSLEDAEPIINNIISLYPIFKAASDVFIEQPDNFLENFQHFLDWCPSDSPNHNFAHQISLYPDDVEDEEYREGLVKKIQVNAYERDQKARQKCIEHYGTDCSVCGFNFGKSFGKLGEGFIHVHHLTPISDIGKEYIVNPIKDLRPVCPNCHAMLHRKNPPFSIQELKQILEDNSP